MLSRADNFHLALIWTKYCLTQVKKKGQRSLTYNSHDIPNALSGSKLCSWLMNIFIKKLMKVTNWLILFSHKKISLSKYSFHLSQEKFFFSAKSLQFTVNYSHNRVMCNFTVVHQSDCLETNSSSAIKEKFFCCEILDSTF